jgi:hypothetical protein
MDIAKVKKMHRDRINLAGIVSNKGFRKGNPEDVLARVKKHSPW